MIETDDQRHHEALRAECSTDILKPAREAAEREITRAYSVLKALPAGAVAPRACRASEAPGVLIVEDDDVQADLIGSWARRAGFSVLLFAANLDQAVRLISRSCLAGAVVDWSLPDGQPLMLLAGLAQRRVPRLVYSGYAEKIADRDLFGAELVAKPGNADLRAWLNRVYRQATASPGKEKAR